MGRPRHGVVQRDLTQLIANSHEVLGQGSYGSVKAVTVKGCDPLCIKVMQSQRDLKAMLREVKFLKALEGVDGLPRVLGFSE